MSRDFIRYGSKGAKKWRDDEIRSRGGQICELCNRRVVTLTIDHDHHTGLVRGFICHPCNLGIGYFKDNFAVMRRAVEYLERAHQRSLDWHKSQPWIDENEEIPFWVKRRSEIISREEADREFWD